MEIEISKEFITLQQLLKIADLVSSGGESKIFLAENKVLINGEEDNRRGRKLRPGDVVVIRNKKYLIVCK